MQNVKGDSGDSLLGVDLASLKSWKYTNEEVLFSTPQIKNNLEFLQAKKLELDNWVKHEVYSEVDDNGQ